MKERVYRRFLADLLKNIEEELSKEELSPWLKEFGGIVNTGRNKNIKSIYNIKK